MLRLTLLFALASLAFAQPRRGRPALQLLDTDKDSIISAAEWKNAPTAFAKLDANGDGQITPDELRPQPQGRPPAEDDMVKTLMAFDKNGDGKLSKAELPERMQGMLARGDKDGDGFLTTAELQAMAPPRQQEGDDHGPRGGGGMPPGGMMRMDPILAAIDADHDGTLSAAELKNAVAALKPLDKDNDGQLSGEEIRPAFGGRGPGRGEHKEH